MKNIVRSLSFLAVLAILFTACDKADELPVYAEGTDNTLTSSKSDITLAPLEVANNAVSFTWTDPKFATDTASIKYVLEFAPTGSNYANSKSITVHGSKSLSVTGLDLNNFLIGWGVPFGTAQILDVRLHSSYGNNNDLKMSNTVKVTVTPVALPFALSTSSTGPIQPTISTKDDVGAQLTWIRPNYGLSSINYTIEYDSAGKNFANPKTITGASDVLSKDLTNGALNIAAKSVGIAANTLGAVDFRIKATINNTNQLSYSSTTTINIKPADLIVFLYVPGDYQGWSPGDAPRLASTDGINFEGYVNVPAGGSGEFKINSNPDWDHTNYGSGATPGTLSTSGGNLVWPAGVGAYYKVNLNLPALTWSATKITTWGVIGDGTPNGWDASTPLTYDPVAKVWSATINFTSGQFKFRANDAWDINLGGNATGLTYGGDNINVPVTGSHTVVLNLNNPPAYSYTIQ